MGISLFSNVEVHCMGCHHSLEAGGKGLGTDIGHDIPMYFLGLIYALYHEIKHRDEFTQVGRGPALGHKCIVSFTKKN